MTTIKYDDIFDKCKMLTSFEGGRLTDASGDTMMDVIALTDQDSDLIKHYFEEGCNLIESALTFAVDDMSFDDDYDECSFDWCYGNSLDVRSNTEKHLIETISAFCVSRWLENKAPERSQAYMGIYTNMLAAISRQANKVKPVLT